MVGIAIATKLVERGHKVVLGARSTSNPKAVEWASSVGPKGIAGSFRDAASLGEVIFNCIHGAGVLDSLHLVSAEALGAKLLIDVSNPLDFSQGMPPSLLHKGDHSLAEAIQEAFPYVKVVKALNTITAGVMVEPGHIPGDHDLFICGNDSDAKAQVSNHLQNWFGWKSIIDLGSLIAARGMEAYVLFWVQVMLAKGNPNFNIKVVS